MSSAQNVDKDLLDNLDLLLAMDVLEKESDWDALGAEGLTDAPDEDLENIEKATDSDGSSSDATSSEASEPRASKPLNESKGEK